ncbi:BTB/POZ and MATH domain-containing protein 4-like [Oryza brachyantha]|uniref:MATH domain-containing protein n=1 Tax=Oryza brachyantha TaxID=4533 RepID=J3MRC2_ORYBR|nr:BTB/POZ and MATH domain-containing protein 4-like [Oryza brachyantha]
MEAASLSVSICTARALYGQKSFTFSNYSLSIGLGPGEFIRSQTFNVGGFDWSIRYYPNGANHGYREYISVFLELMTPGAQVRANFSLRILAGHTQPSETCLINQEDSRVYTYGWEKFIGKTARESSAELMVLNSITIDCDIFVLTERPLVSGTHHVSPAARTPSSESFYNDFARLLESQEGADITFLVKGEAFPAHQVVLIARSPVFAGTASG